ncbi:MAG: hypothetical protein ABFS41_08395, partial [Myxococcota bacterium]
CAYSMVAELNPGAGPARPREVVLSGGTLLFRADDGKNDADATDGLLETGFAFYPDAGNRGRAGGLIGVSAESHGIRLS